MTKSTVAILHNTMCAFLFIWGTVRMLYLNVFSFLTVIKTFSIRDSVLGKCTNLGLIHTGMLVTGWLQHQHMQNPLQEILFVLWNFFLLPLKIIRDFTSGSAFEFSLGNFSTNSTAALTLPQFYGSFPRNHKMPAEHHIVFGRWWSRCSWCKVASSIIWANISMWESCRPTPSTASSKILRNKSMDNKFEGHVLQGAQASFWIQDGSSIALKGTEWMSLI